MSAHRITRKPETVGLAGTALLLAGALAIGGCEAPPGPMGPPAAAAEGAGHTASFVTAALMYTPEPFTVRGPLDPFRINQPPDFMAHLRATMDIVMQRLVFQPGAGGWHTHPGPSFVFVQQGEIKLQRFAKPGGCVETPVFGPGQAYFEVGNEVHRAVVVSEGPAVLHVTRFNIPVGGAISTPADDPGC